MYFLIYFLFRQQKDFCSSKITSLSLHTSSPGRNSHSLLPVSTVRFPKQFRTVKNLPLVYSFNVFFQKIPPSLSNQPGQLHLTLTLCFAFSHLRLCFIFIILFFKPLCLLLDGSRTDATGLCFISIFTLRQNSVFRGMVKIISWWPLDIC